MLLHNNTPYNFISKNYKIQFCHKFNIHYELFDIIFSFLNYKKEDVLIDIILNNNNYILTKKDKNKIYFFRKTTNPFAFSIPYSLIPHNYIYLKYIINTFFILFKKDIYNTLYINKQFPFITINNVNPNWLILNNYIKNNKIIVETNIYKNKINNQFQFLFKINWKTTKLIHNILFQFLNIDKSRFIINHLFVLNNINELIDIEYTTKIKYKHINKYEKRIKKYEILTFLNLFLNNFYSKLKYKYVFSDINENYYEIYGVNKTNINFILNIKIINNNKHLDNINHEKLNNDEIINVINNYLINIFIDNLYYIL
jgi:hypothetical protein